MVKSHGQGNLDLALLYVLFDVGLVLAAPHEDIYSGLWGYNSCLSCIAIGGVFYALTWQSHLLAITCGRFRNNTFTLLNAVRQAVYFMNTHSMKPVVVFLLSAFFCAYMGLAISNLMSIVSTYFFISFLVNI